MRERGAELAKAKFLKEMDKTYAEVPPTSMKIKVKKFGQDDAEMSPSVEITNNVQVRPDVAEMSPSVEIKGQSLARMMLR